MRMNRLDEAMDCIEEALSIGSDNPTCHYIKGFLLMHVNKLEEATVSFEQCLSINPD